MKNPYALLLLVAVTTAYGQINNPVTAGSLGLGPTNDVSFSRLSLSNGASTNLAITLGATNRGFFATGGPERIITKVAGVEAFAVYSNTIETGAGVSATFASNVLVSGTLSAANLAFTNVSFTNPVTFATNVSVAGSLSVGSFTTTTPSTWALDATQTAAATNGVLTLPSNANVLRLTNSNTISAISNGVLGACYFLLNQSTNDVIISNSAKITTRGATNITLGTNQSATLISTTATNASAH